MEPTSRDRKLISVSFCRSTCGIRNKKGKTKTQWSLCLNLTTENKRLCFFFFQGLHQLPKRLCNSFNTRIIRSTSMPVNYFTMLSSNMSILQEGPPGLSLEKSSVVFQPDRQAGCWHPRVLANYLLESRRLRLLYLLSCTDARLI